MDRVDSFEDTWHDASEGQVSADAGGIESELAYLQGLSRCASELFVRCGTLVRKLVPTAEKRHAVVVASAGRKHVARTNASELEEFSIAYLRQLQLDILPRINRCAGALNALFDEGAKRYKRIEQRLRLLVSSAHDKHQAVAHEKAAQAKIPRRIKWIVLFLFFVWPTFIAILLPALRGLVFSLRKRQGLRNLLLGWALASS